MCCRAVAIGSDDPRQLCYGLTGCWLGAAHSRLTEDCALGRASRLACFFLIAPILRLGQGAATRACPPQPPALTFTSLRRHLHT